MSYARVKRARRALAGQGILRMDSDDELGSENLMWEWIYDTPYQNTSSIKGAKFGSFQCELGDCILLKAEMANEAWVGIACEFKDDEETGEKCANFMWFSTEREIRNKSRRRTDTLFNELYITSSFDWNPLTTINGTAKVMSPERFALLYPSRASFARSPDNGKTFVCRRGCNTRTATYTDEFLWEEIYCGGQDIDGLIKRIRTQTKATRMKSRQAVDDLNSPKMSLGQVKSASGRAVGSYQKSLEYMPLETRARIPGEASTPFQLARGRLHVASVPSTLPCREAAFATVYAHLEKSICEGGGTCIYVSGTPGTGKTATVRQVIAELHEAVHAEELDDFIFVEVNGLKLTDPQQSYSLLWEALVGQRVSPIAALGLLEREFSNPSPRRVPCVVLMDELDQLVTKNQSVMYNFFNWPSLRHSQLIVLAVANTMDLPERTLSNKISSRLGLTRITFAGYTHEQLVKIIQSRLEDVPDHLIDPDAIQFAGRKVAAVSGDARRALDICRRAVELAELGGNRGFQSSKSNGSRNKTLGVATDKKVTIASIKEAINEATANTGSDFLRALPLSSKVLLAAISTKARITGISECNLGEAIDEGRKMIRMSEGALAKIRVGDFPAQTKTEAAVARTQVPSRDIFDLGTAIIHLTDAGIIGVESRKGQRGARVKLNLNQEEVRMALKNDAEIQNFSLAA